MPKPSQPIMKPMEILRRSVERNILVNVRGNREYSGVLDGYDIYMNIVLKNATETINGENKGSFGTLLVRGDNVVFVSPSGGDSA
ncbi:MAG: small nuclear ribonucleoprotein [Candidatus Thermoplasmatota archaeon]|nr:small nuclear ribonucleoprotein [Candidatus Thermoplasmatota archaeon]MCL5665394.1 small nuclear ribonucleoprotein [Candidatus Thermoplasmatota archaeon]